VVSTFDTAAQQRAERAVPPAGGEGVVEDVPGELSGKRGTNIRWAHHDALRWVAQKRPRKTFLSLVSDSYNDAPAPDDPALAKYRAYYKPNSLTAYPDTEENRDYERLLRRRVDLGITTWGIGVEIDRRTGRPIERYLAPPPAESPPAPEPPPAAAPEAPAKGSGTWIWLALILLALAAAAFWWASASRPVGASLAEGARSYRNFRLRPGAAISIGGAGAAEYDLGYPIPGTSHPVALVRRSGKRFRLEPAAGVGDAVVVLNGEVLKQAVPIVPGDEIRIRLPGAEGAAPGREVRLEFNRSREEA
jgi:hypothetical protein